ncbi:hypothetical protein GP486_002489 [Trichoglossum hirsutum]|uniref:Fungal N-terminal domain-containing protein n=1 Tax=Trichoglossum hirsutum TaxID=265104 RepID=A0A9P8RS17_9PEZI|nr:hypothetical protein GP486_002489 [Trichoglossum hirsutum]
MDPLSITASIAALLHLSGAVVQYLNEVKSASSDRQKILDEVVTLSGLLYHLRSLVERNQQTGEWLETMSSLSVPNGPLDRLGGSLGFLSTKLAPQKGLKKVGKAISWPFQGREVKEVLEAMERQKVIIGLAMQNDHM